MSLTKVTYSMIAGASINVLDYGAKGDGVTDDTAAIAAAIAAAGAIAYEEKGIYFPAGNYCVTHIDLSDTTGIVFVTDGSVLITGNNSTSHNYILGSTNYDPVTPSNSTVTRYFKMIGGTWFINPANGTSYTYGLRLESFVNCNFNNVYVSGNYGVNVADRIAVYLQYSYINKFNNCSFGSPGATTTGFFSYNVFHDNNNCNLNVYDGCRVVGTIGNYLYGYTVGFLLNGVANTIQNCDISGIYCGVNFLNSRGGVFQNNYHESNGICYSSGFNGQAGSSYGNTFIGGFYEVLENAVAFELSDNAGGCQNVTIIGPRVLGYVTETNQTFIAQKVGGAVYGLNVIAPDLSNIANTISGTYLGNAAPVSFGITQSAWVSFPSTQQPSTDANTLDDYAEGTFDFGISFGGAFTGVTYSSKQGSYTKIGNRVMVSGSIALTSKGSSTGNARITGLPFTIANNANAYSAASLSLSNITFADTPSGYGEINGTTIVLQETTNAGVITSLTDADFANNSSIIVSFCYQAA